MFEPMPATGTHAERKLQRRVASGMLDRVSDFVRRHAEGRDAVAAIDRLAEPQGLRRRVVVVGQGAVHRFDFHVVDAVGLQDRPRDISASQSGSRTDLRVSGEGALHLPGRDEAQQEGDAEDDQISGSHVQWWSRAVNARRGASNKHAARAAQGRSSPLIADPRSRRRGLALVFHFA
jgi:hypothetical protein